MLSKLSNVKGLQRQFARWSEAISRHERGVRTLTEAMFSLNVASAAGYALFSYISRSEMSWAPISTLGYILLRGAVRMDDLLGIASITAVSTSAVARSDFPIHRVGLELTFSITVLAVAFLIFAPIHLCGRSSRYRVATQCIAGGITLLLAPACYLAMSGLTLKWIVLPEDAPGEPTQTIILLTIFVIEVLMASIFVPLRTRRLAVPLAISFTLLHYALWISVLWNVSPTLLEISAPRILLSAFPLAGITWLLSLRQPPIALKKNTRTTWAWMFGAGSIGILLLIVLWLPHRGYSFVESANMDSLTIQLSRGPCYGTCPQYTLRLHGNGTVEYDGVEYVAIKGHHEGKINKEQLLRILQSLDHADFSTLEDRAFQWCFDSSSVAVRAEAGVRTKRVASDGFCTGATSGPQRRFVQAARAIDLIVGSDSWVLCNGRSCPR
ncbi:MAG TPA: DUF6438 domain-containing protein [Candidatus Angelobacter sp.]|nr:DUF6438 domain-containing protein [Candidatus Angelobacter sp.]